MFPPRSKLNEITLRKPEAQISSTPAAPVFFLVVSTAILVLAYLERPVESTIAVLTVAAGIPAYFLFTRRSAVEGDST